MHLYIRSVVSPLYELLRIYDLQVRMKNTKTTFSTNNNFQGYAKIIPWPRLGMKFVPEADFNPNLNVEFRNQAAAQTDCLLQNKVCSSSCCFKWNERQFWRNIEIKWIFRNQWNSSHSSTWTIFFCPVLIPTLMNSINFSFQCQKSPTRIMSN